MRVLLSCAELGLGHVSRVIPLGKRLEKRGNEVFFFSGGAAYQRLKEEFENVYPCRPVSWYENAHGIITSASLLNILFPLPNFNHERNAFEIKSSNAAETIHRYYDLRRHIRKIKPDVIVSDGDMHALRLAHRWKIPAVYITNLIRPTYGFSPLLIPGERFTERYVKNCSKIIVPDNPPPYTICEYNLGNLEDIGIADKVEFVGSFLDMTPTEGSEDYIFAPISGPLGTRAKLTNMIIPVLRELKLKSLVSLGVFGEKSSVKIGNCEIHTWLSPQERIEYMKNAKFIIFSGGHTTCLETIKYVKPSICIPTQPEQLGNAKKMQHLNCSIVAENKKELRQAIQKIDEKRDFYKSNLRVLSRYFSEFKGIENTARIIENVAKF
jgi:UDP-N-acetylglucosamine--N-acetylmuramyl-(pentapeptide) pyrophosphoryl-undecaprenol N-acetylglucosamine transferase